MAEFSTAPQNSTSVVQVLPSTQNAGKGDGEWSDVLVASFWPLLVLIALLMFKRPLATALAGLGARLKSVSLLGLTLDLAEASAKPITDEKVSEAVGTQVNESGGATLMKLADAEPADYAVIDLGDGKAWITSRLYVVVSILAQVLRLRAVVFVGKHRGVKPRFIAMAGVDALRWKLAARYPWLELAFEQATTETLFGPQEPKGAATLSASTINIDDETGIPASRAAKIFNSYIQSVRMYQNPPPDQGWLNLAHNTWERAEYVTREKIIDILRDAPIDHAVVGEPDASKEEFERELLRASGDLVAVVSRKGVLLRVADREALLNKIALRLAQ